VAASGLFHGIGLEYNTRKERQSQFQAGNTGNGLPAASDSPQHVVTRPRAAERTRVRALSEHMFFFLFHCIFLFSRRAVRLRVRWFNALCEGRTYQLTTQPGIIEPIGDSRLLNSSMTHMPVVLRTGARRGWVRMHQEQTWR
jgi:hypothetical protein